MPTNPSLGSTQRSPTRSVGPAGQDANEGYGMLVFSASGNSGLVATCYGLRGLSAEYLGTGRYQLNFPITQGVIIHPSLEAPSGVHYDLSIVSRASISGMAELHVGRGSGATLGHLKPVSGTKVLLRFSFHPRVAF